MHICNCWTVGGLKGNRCGADKYLSAQRQTGSKQRGRGVGRRVLCCWDRHARVWTSATCSCSCSHISHLLFIKRLGVTSRSSFHKQHPGNVAGQPAEPAEPAGHDLTPDHTKMLRADGPSVNSGDSVLLSRFQLHSDASPMPDVPPLNSRPRAAREKSSGLTM